MNTKLTTREIGVDEYPPLLRQISQLPKTLNMAGIMPPQESKYLCIVGSRKNSNYGKEACVKLVQGLKGYPIVIVSGLANGIDSIAHQAALDAGLKTISFPGSGLSLATLYPAERRQLALDIIQNGGALISPFTNSQEGTKWTFPNRNRLMAGCSHATLIIEAAKKSGTLITADFATKMDRDVLAVPGSIFSELSYGPHMLIRRGATPVTSSADILQALGFQVIRKDGMNEALPNFSEMQLNEDQRNIVGLLKTQPLNFTELIEKTGLTTPRLNTIISELELLSVITQTGENYKIF